jgi:hypothetical protein
MLHAEDGEDQLTNNRQGPQHTGRTLVTIEANDGQASLLGKQHFWITEHQHAPHCGSEFSMASSSTFLL